MLFSSYEFILFFLPVTLLIFFAIARQGKHEIAIAWLIIASFFFYGWWNPKYILLLAPLIVANYFLGLYLLNTRSRPMLVFGVTLNLAVLGYFKYANFFIDNVDALLGVDWDLKKIILPLAISFFTFQKIAYLVDCYRGEGGERNFLHFCLFVTFFPQLIAGPIVHHKQILPQFAKTQTWIFNWDNIAKGVTLFIIGLTKKVLLADDIAQFATPVFHAADTGIALSFFEAWGGALAYTLQLYFDFSGYADMAIGASLMFGIHLPINFNSPYKASSITEFWRRWHMTLSQFLRDYVYFPLGGNRKGKIRRQTNLLLTMLLGGLWHGAGWNFVIWGGLHGFYLIINHGWRALRQKHGNAHRANTIGNVFSIALTFICVVIAWVFFRAETYHGAIGILSSMLDFGALRVTPQTAQWGPAHLLPLPLIADPEATRFVDAGLVKRLLIGALIIWALPNSQQYVGTKTEANSSPARWRWHPSWLPAVIFLFLLFKALFAMDRISEFLYFQF